MNYFLEFDRHIDIAVLKLIMVFTLKKKCSSLRRGGGH